MKHQSLILFLVIVLSLIVLAACGEPTETPPPAATETPVPTATARPTRTPTPTPIPIPLEVELDDAGALGRFPPTESFVLRFNQPMDVESVAAPLLISPILEGVFRWDDTQTTLSFAPRERFAPGQTYLVVLDEQLASADGQFFDELLQWELNVLPAPKVVGRTPRIRTINERRLAMQVSFSQEMDPTSVAEALRVDPPLPLSLHWDGNVLVITPDQPLAPGTTYYFSLGPTAASRSGVQLTDEVRWSYRLDSLVESVTAPTADDREAPITIRFNYAMDQESVREALVVEPAVMGDLGWSQDATVAVLVPAARLPNNTEYTITFDGILRDANGDEFPPLEPLGFRTPPPILRALPLADDYVHPATTIEVTFDRLMDEETTAAALEIVPDTVGTVAWRETTLIFRPEGDVLVENTPYTVTIGTAATGAEGESILDEPYTWSFRTSELQDLVSFGQGPNAQVLDAAGRRAVQFQIYQVEPLPVTFELHELTLEQFLDRYASGFRGVAGWDMAPISTEGADLVKQWQVETLASEREWNNVQEVIIPEDVSPGLYILNLVVGRVNDQLILVLTNNTLLVKEAGGQLVTWATDINGEPLAGIEVGVYARNGELIASGQADEGGVFRTRVQRDPQPLIVVARDGEDLTASGLSNEWRGQGGWWGWWEPEPEALDHALYIYTDRPIYRPGQTVYFKGIVRQDDDAILDMVPAGTGVTVRIRDARNNVLQTIELVTNHFGTVNGEFNLADGAMLGTYAVEMVLEGESHRQAFKVEDYRKPDYEVSVRTDADRYVTGETVRVTLHTSYFFGEPVANADVVVSRFLLGERYWWMEGDDDFIWYQSYTDPITGKTDADGRLTLTLPAEMSYYVSQVNWRSSLEQSIWAIEATVDDGSRQTVSGFAVYRVFNAAERVDIDTGGYAKEPGKSFTVRAQVTTVDDEPVSGRSLQLDLLRWDRSSYGYNTVVQSAQLTTGADGRVRIPFTIEQPGYYQIRLRGRDRLGNETSATSWVYAFSDSYAAWFGRESDLTIEADRESYAPGDKARLLIESSFSGPALLTYERGSVRREQLVELTAPLTLIEIPVQADDAPNVFVTVSAWREQDTTLTEDTWESLPDSRLFTASAELVVPVTDRTLSVTIIPDRTTYGPREEATVTIRVTNSQGEPVSTEVSLAMVDEAIFALSEELSGPIFEAFYHRRDNVVKSYNSMAPSRYLGGGLGGGGGGGDLAGNPRSDFPDTAEWFPVLHTDAQGEVSVTFTLPDNLTSWRLTAKAATADTQVGETTINILTKQEVVVRPILPRSLTAGDRIGLTALIHNYGQVLQDIDVSLAASGSAIDLLSPVTQTVRVPAGGLRVVGWELVALAEGAAEFTIRADVGEETKDAVRLPVPIRPLAVPDVDTQVGHFSGELATTFLMPTDALGMSTVRIELSRSIAGSLLEGLEYLTGFPYGCVEQTMSRALPNAVVGRALYQLGVSDPTLEADLPAKINAGLQRLYGYQHNDGGWGWWYDDQTDAYQTAWVVFGLAVTAEAGYEVDPGVIERGAEWLRENLQGMDIRTQAYALYSLATAGYGDLEVTRALAGRLDELDTFSQSALALALHALGAAREAQDTVDYLVETAIVGEGKVYWAGEDYDGHYYQKTMASSTRSTALALSAFVHVDPGHPFEPDIVRWLMGQRRQQGWGSTNETSFAIIALTDHLLTTQEATAQTEWSVELNGETIASGTLGPTEPAVSLDIPAAEAQAGLNRLRIRQSGSGRLYYVISSRVYLAQEQIQAAGEIKVTREYLDLQSGVPITTAVPGQLVTVRLVITLADTGSFIIVEDNLPGGLEALNERLNTTSHVASVDSSEEPRYFWEDYGYNQKEVYGDRVTFFITEMESGRHTFTYVARATHVGEFLVLPAEVSAMYDLSKWGRSASDSMVIWPAGEVQVRVLSIDQAVLN
jgi:uncharacterized protein YfaS (alpha-2-macroglobulin family)